MPTHSILGSGMAEENSEDFRVFNDPGGKPLGMVRALCPDLTILHAWAADPAGNVLRWCRPTPRTSTRPSRRRKGPW